MELTPFQPVGPYFHVMLDGLGRVTALAGPEARGERITIEGVLRDGEGKPLPDGMIELWQADSEGRYAHPEDPRGAAADPHFWGYGRTDTNDAGMFRFETIKPGPVPGSGSDSGMQAPHILVSVYAPGILLRWVTRIYFEDEPANAADPVLQLVPAHRCQTLVAKRDGHGYRFDIVLQGEGETVFFDV
jgi:protocatechuate 3,4-dioxygenase alpha subunit